MEEELKIIVDKALVAIEVAADNKELAARKVEIMGKNGALTGILRNLKSLPAEQRPLAR